MTDTAGPQPDATADTPPARTIVQMLLRALASSAVLLTVYYLLPLNHSSRWLTITMLVIGLVLLTGLVTGQMIIDLIILGVGVRVITGAITRGRQRRAQNTGA